MKKSLFTLFFALVFCSIPLFAQTSLITNIPNRETISLDGKWHYVIDPYETGYYNYRLQPHDETPNPGSGAYFTNTKANTKHDRVEYDFDLSPTLYVPGSWNAQDDKLLYYEGTVWYQRNFQYQKKDEKRAYLYFGAVNYEAHVYVNGQKVGSHIGGFTPFNFEVTDILKDGDNFVTVKVDNTRSKEAVPTVNTDWWNHGGITRSVQLVEVPEKYIRTYKIQLEKGKSDVISGFVQVEGGDKQGEITLSIPELNIEEQLSSDANGMAVFTLKAKKLVLWDTKNPKLYEVRLKMGDEVLVDKIGFRTIETKGTDILLNGEKVFLRGICVHEENPMTGRRNHDRADAQLILGWVKELNANFVRLAHYPHNEHMARLADEMGILLWEEVPVYWTIQWENQQTLVNAQNQLTELIQRDQNRASVIIWSMANETPVSEARNNFLKALVETTRSLDDTRLISAALEVHSEGYKKTMDDPFGEFTDIVSFNQYHGWYGGDINEFSKLNWEVKYNKPVIVSEWGAGALYGFRADNETIWSEDFQAHLYTKTLEGIDNIPGLSGFTPWILSDFRSPKRNLPKIQDGWNRKGIIGENGYKKLAFKVLQDYYQKVKDSLDK